MKKQSGSVLVLTAITVAVLMVAGVSFVSHTTVEHKANVNSTQTIQAFYLAEAGLAWGTQQLQTFVSIAKELPIDGSFLNLSALQTYASDETFKNVTLTYKKLSDTHGQLISEANTAGSLNKVVTDFVLHVTESSEGGEYSLAKSGFPTAILSNGSVTVQSKVEGPVLLASGGVDIKGQGQCDSPTIDPNAFSKVHNTQLALPKPLPSNSTYIPTLLINNSYTINTGTEKTDHVDIVVDTLDVKSGGKIVLEGKGTATIYVNNTISINGAVNIYDASKRLLVYYDGTQKITLSGNANISATLWARNADITVNNIPFVGDIVTGGSSVSISGGGQSIGLVFAPKALVSVSGNSTVLGGLVCNKGDIGGGALVKFDPDSEGYFIGDLIPGSGAGVPESAYVVLSNWRNR